MKKIILGALWVIFPFLLQAQTDIVGTWLNEDQTAKVEVMKQGEGYEGKLVWVKDERGQDKLGEVIFKDLTTKGKKWNGEVFAMRRGEHYDATYAVISEGKALEIEVSVGLFSQKQTWTRVE
ncbi:MAG: DUF2147 domain-containing protein [Bacteroidota bacterium]